MTNVKPHFELHFKQKQFVLYEETNQKYYRKQWQEIAGCGDIKRIHYNTEKWKNYLIIDIDNPDLYKYKENNLPEPNFILKNKHKEGGHLFYVLDKGVYFKNEYYLNKWKILQKEFTTVAGGDPLNKGYVGKFINSIHFEYIEINPYAYDIDFLYSKINIETSNNQAYSPKKFNPYIIPTKKEKKPYKANMSLNLIQIGERNNTLFEKVRKYAYIQVLQLNKQDFKRVVFEYSEKLNNSLLTPLNKAEIKATARSINKYCLKNIDKIKAYKTEKHVKRGIMELTSKEISLKEKQRLAAEYTAKQKNNKTILKLSISLNEMKQQGLKINISTLSKYAKISRPTIIKYKENLEF